MAPTKHFYLAEAFQPATTLATPPALQRRLSGVLRLGIGAEIGLFNGKQGLWAARLKDAKAKQLEVLQPLLPQPAPTQGVTLVLGLPKREAWETALRQATELGVGAIQPLTTQYSQRDKFNAARAQSLLIEAAEQCERLTLPTLLPLQRLEDWLKNLQAPCAWAYERGGKKLGAALGQALVGPEGGFAPAEVAALSAHTMVTPFSLGPTVLRTDTAVVAALAKLG